MHRWCLLEINVIWKRREWSQWIVADCWQNSWVSVEATLTFCYLVIISISPVCSCSHVTCSLPLEGFEFFETSAKDNINVKQTFERLVDLICDKMSESLDTDPAVTTGAPTAKLTDSAPPLQQPGCNC